MAQILLRYYALQEQKSCKLSHIKLKYNFGNIKSYCMYNPAHCEL